MNALGTLLLGLLAAGDMAMVAYLHKRHGLHLRAQRMARCLAEAVRRELPAPDPQLCGESPCADRSEELILTAESGESTYSKGNSWYRWSCLD
jgi:hypothetical protein